MPSAKTWGRFFIKATPLIIIDILATFAAFITAAWGTQVIEQVMAQPTMISQVVLLSLINVFIFGCCGLYSSLWKYASAYEVSRIVFVTLAATAIGDIICAVVFGWRMPMRVYICEWFILLVVVGASRMIIRLNSSWRGWSLGNIKSSGLPKALIIGAGDSGSLVIKRMNEGENPIPLCPVCLLDDDPNKMGKLIHGVKVVGTTKDIVEVCKKYEVEQIVLAAPSATSEQKKAILDLCMQTGLKVMSVPATIKDASPAEQNKVVLKDVDVCDLLAREEIDLDLGQMEYITGKRVLVTGGGGSIGSEIVRQLLPARPLQIVLLDFYENTTYSCFYACKDEAAKLGVDFQVEIGSITHMPAIGGVFEKYHPEVVFHAAAHKHVPLMENNVREAIENNIFGTLNVVRLADEYKCSHFILISTDKAVNPTNAMGATKRMCEMIVQYYSRISDTKFAAVRFGNVLGSHGSVIPLFKEQLKKGGPLTVTHKDIIRYFMTIPEASKLVITAGAFAEGGEIFVLDMGEPVRIYDLAVNLIRLSGFNVKQPGEEGPGIAVELSGLRPGEKLYEEIHQSSEPVRTTANGQITVICGMREEVDTVEERLRYLLGHIDASPAQLKAYLADVVPTYHPQFSVAEEQALEVDSVEVSNVEDERTEMVILNSEYPYKAPGSKHVSVPHVPVADAATA